jgi:acyl dehydratase
VIEETAMLIVSEPSALSGHTGRKLGPTDWILVDQEKVNRFADCSGDHQWIHVDVERAAREMPGGKTIVHGWLTASLLPAFATQFYRVEGAEIVERGANRIRYMQTIPVGSRLRASQTLLSVSAGPGGWEVVSEIIIEIEGSTRPAAFIEHVAFVG